MELDLTKDILGITEFRATMGDSLERMEQTKRPLILTKGGKPSVVVLPVQSYQELLDTLETLNRKTLLEGVHQAEADIQAGRVIPHSEVDQELQRRKTHLHHAKKTEK